MTTIIIDNQVSRIIGKRKLIHKVRNDTKLRAPGYFYSPAYHKRQWDGYTKYVTENGNFTTGLIGLITDWFKANKKKYKLEDRRVAFKHLYEVDQLGDLKFRPYQKAAVNAVLTNKFEGLRFTRGILDEATNAGKNLISAGIFESFGKKRRGLFLIDSKVIYEQALEELEELMPGQIGRIDAKKKIWGRVTVAMVQSLANFAKRDPKARAELAKQDILLVDECDTTVNKKQAEYILSHCYDAPIRIGLSGTPLDHKDKTRNRKVLSFFGPVVHRITNAELVEQGVSVEPDIRMIMGNKKPMYSIHRGQKINFSYAEQEQAGIIKNKQRNRRAWAIAKKKALKGPVIILIKYHEHIKQLMKVMPEGLKDIYRIESVHHDTKNRKDIFKRFKEGKIDILISSMIIRRGLNLKIMKTLLNAAGGVNHANIKQLLGRALRNYEGKKVVYLYDFFDIGKDLARHSRKRLVYYKKEKFIVKELYKKLLKKYKTT